MNYNGTIYRPPIEAETLLLPVTEGCSHNFCRFCSMYRGIKFRILSAEEIIAQIKNSLPNIEIVTMYAAIRNIKAKTDENLRRLKNLGVESAQASAALVNEIKPAVILITTMTAFPDKRLADDIAAEKLIAGFIVKERAEMLETLQNAIDTIDEEKFARTFRRDHI